MPMRAMRRVQQVSSNIQAVSAVCKREFGMNIQGTHKRDPFNITRDTRKAALKDKDGV